MFDPNTNYFKPLNSRERKRLYVLKRRRDWLEERINNIVEDVDRSFDRREFSALSWAIGYIEAHNEEMKYEGIDGLAGEEEFLAIKQIEKDKC